MGGVPARMSAALHRQPRQRCNQRHGHRAAQCALRPLALCPYQRRARRWHQPWTVRDATAPSARTPCAWPWIASRKSAGLDWLSTQILGSISPALGLPWILDIDVTVKPLYGHQQGAEIGYNPQKPGRPSHVYHSYFVANLRISLGVEVRPGNEHAAAKGLPGLWQTLEKLPRHQWPTFIRGDCGYGSETIMLEYEERVLPYLFKLRHTAKVKDLVKRMMRQGALWQDCGDGWQALESTIRLSGWTRERRVILVRESPVPRPRGGDRQSPAGQRTVRNSCPMPTAADGKRKPRPGAARSPCSSLRWMRLPFPPRSCPSTTATAPTPKTSLTNSRTNGDGTALPRANLRPAGSWPTSSRCFTTGGISICAFTTKNTTAKPSAAAPCSWPEWGGRSKAADGAPSR